jgi:hypothetical protein
METAVEKHVRNLHQSDMTQRERRACMRTVGHASRRGVQEEKKHACMDSGPLDAHRMVAVRPIRRAGSAARRLARPKD